MLKKEYQKYIFFEEPTVYAQEHLMVSDAMGNECSPAFYIEREHFHNNLVMFVLDGKLHVEQFGVHYELTRGQGILMRLEDWHKYYTDKEDVASFLWFHFRGSLCDPIVNHLGKAGYLPLIFQSDKIKGQILKCFDITKVRRIGYELELSATLYGLFIDIVRKKISEFKYLTMQDCFINEVNKYIDEHIYEQITLEKLAVGMHCSKYHFCRIFKQYFGTTPIRYILHKKIKLAKKMLIYTNEKTESIAEKLGFTDQSHFSKAFKCDMGISPSQYRRNSRCKKPLLQLQSGSFR